jgi:hypothetical protein
MARKQTRKLKRNRRRGTMRGGWPWSKNQSVASARAPSMSAPSKLGSNPRSSVRGVLTARAINVASAPLKESIAYLVQKVSDLDASAPRLLSSCNTNLHKYFDEKIKELEETKRQLEDMLTKTVKPADQIPQCSNLLKMYGDSNTTPYKAFMQDLGKFRAEMASFNAKLKESTEVSDAQKGEFAAMVDSLLRGGLDTEKIKGLLKRIEVKASAPNSEAGNGQPPANA